MMASSSTAVLKSADENAPLLEARDEGLVVAELVDDDDGKKPGAPNSYFEAFGATTSAVGPGTVGLYMQYFAVGVVYGGLPSTIYGFFLGYLNVDSYVYATAATIVALPWSFKFAFGALNDCVPIYGYRRKPYMVIGWAICTAALLRLAMMPLPRPYWCVNRTQDGYIREGPGGGAAAACNPRAADAGGVYALWMMLAATGYCIADVAADGLTVTYARAEPLARRGATQTTVYLVRTLGNVFAVLLVGICMNSWQYNGTFSWGLSFSNIMGLFSIPAAVMIPASWTLVYEQRTVFVDDGDGPATDEVEDLLLHHHHHHHHREGDDPLGNYDDLVGVHAVPTRSASKNEAWLSNMSMRSNGGGGGDDDENNNNNNNKKKNKNGGSSSSSRDGFVDVDEASDDVQPVLLTRVDQPHHPDEPRYERRRTFRQYLRSTWELLRGRAMFYVILYEFLTPLIGNISTTAGGEVKQHWAHVKTLQNSLFSLVGLGLFAFGLWLVKTRFLDASWRQSMLITTVVLNCIDLPFTFLTIFGVVRNQYFYLGETVLYEIPAAANFVVATFVIVEMAEGGDEGLVYGLLTTTANLGSPVAGAISNQLFGLFRPALSTADNYIEDSHRFRNVVAQSFALSYAFAFLSLVTLPLLPDQKREVQDRKRIWRKADFYAYATITIVGLGLCYSVSVNLMAMFPTTMCLRVAGGPGC